MSKLKLIGLNFLLVICFSNCEVEFETSTNSNDFTVETNETAYLVGDDININITNDIDETAYHYICDNSDLSYDQILRQTEDDWTEESNVVVCTTMGPMGFFGSLEQHEMKNETIQLDVEGAYKLKYTFIMNADTISYFSNEFTVEL